MGRKSIGLARIRQALQSGPIENNLPSADHLFIASTFFSAGGATAERQAVQWALGGAAKGATPGDELLGRFADTCLLRRDHGSIARLVACIDDEAALLALFDKCTRLLEDTAFVKEFAEQLRPKLDKLAESRQIPRGRRADFKRAANRAKALLS